jgi:type IV secretion system protein VirD4
LLTKDDARRLPEDASIIIVNGRQPVKVKAIKHFADRRFKKILAQQDKLSWDLVDGPLREARLSVLERNQARSQARQQKADVQPVEQVATGPTLDDLNKNRAMMDQIFGIADEAQELPDKVAAEPSIVVRNKAKKPMHLSNSLGFQGDPEGGQR